jgi:hypothetical protein
MINDKYGVCLPVIPGREHYAENFVPAVIEDKKGY